MKITDNVYRIIDSIPEFPYFILALLFVFIETIDRAKHVLAMIFVYVMAGLLMGILVKCTLKTKRPKEHYKLAMICYDVPSLHTIIAVGLVFFSYFINPLYLLLLTPLALLYMKSRISLGFHTKKAVAVGALLGALVGSTVGYIMWKISFSEEVELLFLIIVLIIPIFATYLRIVNYRRMRQD